MKFNFIISNPPFDWGVDIINAIIQYALKADTQTVIIGPLSMYKPKSNYKYITFHENIDNIFNDAIITKNLSITQISSVANDRISWQDIEMESYNQNLIEFYRVNSKLPLKYIFRRNERSLVSSYNYDTDFIESKRLSDESTNSKSHGYSIGDNLGYNINVLHKIPTNISKYTCWITFESNKAKENFTKWAYSDKDKDNLANKVLFGLKKATISESCSIAIPQIDWEHISETELWKQDKYDNAVLDIMRLKWNANRDSLERRFD